MNRSLIIIDCQYDFIDGSLACINAENAIAGIIDFVNENPGLNVYYSCDWHSENNKSFKRHGGIWPDHCVAGQRGSEIHEDFYTKIADEKNRPNEDNIFYKGQNDEIEEYSAFGAKNAKGIALKDLVDQIVMVCGIASEYCCRETALEFDKAGKDVEFLSDKVAYVDREDHEKNLSDLKDMIKVLGE